MGLKKLKMLSLFLWMTPQLDVNVVLLKASFALNFNCLFATRENYLNKANFGLHYSVEMKEK